MTTPIRIIQWGLGAMGSGMARLLQLKSGIKIVVAFDQDPNKIRQDLGIYMGGVESGVLIQAPPRETEGVSQGLAKSMSSTQ
ncbi:hypothetical protein JCM15765_42540 [Paradesulfitobacterium aromaticivorans]